MQRTVTVIEAAESLALVDLATVKDEFGIALDDESQDARLTRYIATASAQIHGFCQRIFPAQTYRNIFLQIGCGALSVSERPVIELIGVSSDGAAADDYEIDNDTGLMWRLVGGIRYRDWYCGTLTVDFRAGYEEIPVDVQAAAILLVRLRQGLRGWNAENPRDPALRAREADTYGRMEFFGNTMPNTVHGMPADVAQMLEHYVRPVFA